MDWAPYKACCFSAASSLDPEVGFCPECGHPLMRCVGFSDCRKLVVPGLSCPGCLAPQLLIDAGAVVSAKAGDRMSVPLILTNQSSAGRPLWVKRISRVDGRSEEQLSIPWEQVDVHRERRFWLDAALAEGGRYTLNVRLVLATRYKSVEEEFAFAAGIAVEAARQEAGNRVNVVNIGAGDVMGSSAAGHMFNAPIHIGAGDSGSAATALLDKKAVPLERAERYELEQNIRGYRKEGLRVLRNVDVSFSGFGADDTPPASPALLPRGRLLFGRNSRPPVPDNVTANDVRLLAFDPRTKKVDEPATMAISRHHFDFVVVNDRLAVQVKAASGMQVNGETLTAGQLFPLAHGDRLIPIPGRADKLTLRVGFANGIGVVNRIDVSRTPAVPT
jgi:hypothetical protein